jgi:hypothetical protein
MNGRYCILDLKSRDLISSVKEDRIGQDQERINSGVTKSAECSINFTFIACLENVNLQTQPPSRFEHFTEQRLKIRPVWIHQNRNCRSIWHKLPNQL